MSFDFKSSSFLIQYTFFLIAIISVSSLRNRCISQGHEDAQLGFLIEVY